MCWILHIVAFFFNLVCVLFWSFCGEEENFVFGLFSVVGLSGFSANIDMDH